MLFYGQEHCDTMSIFNDNKDYTVEEMREIEKNQKIFSNRNLMLNNFRKLIEHLTDCENYIQSAIANEQVTDPSIGRMINKCLGQFTSEDMALLEQMVQMNFKDAVMTNSLSKLQMAQIGLSEKINNLFSQSLNQYILHQNKKF